MHAVANIALSFLLHFGTPQDVGVRRSTALAVAHSHNDYERARPLAEALENGFASVEADLWWSGGQIVVSHIPFFHRGTLDDLYLRPLQERVSRLGSVYGDGRAFYLWLDIKEDRRELTDALHVLLERFPMLTVFTDNEVRPGPVVAVLTGDERAKARFTDERPVRRACRDSNRFRPDDPPADPRWSWYALPWRDVLRWDGSGAIPDAERTRIQALVRAAHLRGRRVRLYEVPERPEAWSAAIAAGVDLVGTDHPAALREFLVPSSVAFAWAAAR